MNLLFMANNGLPRNGLVALYDPYRDTYGRNILPVGSENFANSSHWYDSDGAVCTVTAGQADVNGGNGAYRIQSTGGTLQIKKRLVSGMTGITGITLTTSVWIKVNTGKCIIRQSGILSGTDSTLLTSNTWQKIILSGLEGSGYTLSLRFLTETVSDSLDITVFQPQFNLGQLYPYSPPAGLPQSLTDFSGRGNSAQLGSAAGADTNDPAYSGQGLVFGTDDYCISSSPAFDDMSAFTCITVCKQNTGVATNCRIFDKNRTGLYLRQDTRTLVGYRYRTSIDLAVSAETIDTSKSIICAFSIDNNFNYRMRVNDQKLTLTNSPTSTGIMQPDAASDLFIGNKATADASFDGTIYLQAWYNRILSDTEYMQAYNYLRRLMSSRGVSIG